MAVATHPIDIIIFVGFLVINLIVGLRYGRSVKTIKDYALGGKNFSTATLVATIVATWSSGSLLFIDIENTYSHGLYYLIACSGLPIGLLLTSWLAARMEEFMHHVSIAEAIGSIYGKAVQIITALSGIIAKSGYTAMQFKVMSTMIASLFNLDSTTTTCIAAGIVIMYSSLGGIRAVTFTDVLQFFTFGAIIPLLALVVWNSIQAPEQVMTTLAENPIFDIKKVVGWHPRFLSTLNLFVYFVIPGVYAPEMFQRIAMARDTRQVRHAFTYAAGLFLLITLFTAWIGILLLTDNPGLAKEAVVPYMINTYTYMGLKGLLGIGVMALAMSTADSLLNSSSVLFANDIVKPLTRQKEAPVIIARSFVLGMGLIALLLALYTRDLLSLLMLSGSFYLPIITVPMLLAVLGFRSSTRAVLIGMVAGFVTVILWSIVLDNADSIFPGMLANLIGLMGSHYLLGEEGGWKEVAPNSSLALERAARRQAWRRRLQAIQNFRIYPYLQQNLPAQENFYFFFGLYTMAATYAAFYTIGDATAKIYEPIYTGIYQTMLPITTTFLTFPIWPSYLKSRRFITFFWPLGIGAVLFFVGTLLAIMSQFHYMQVMIMMINLLMAVLLLRWPLALFLAFTGIALATSFFTYYTGTPLLLSALGSLQLRILYGLLLFTSFLITLFKGKQAYQRLSTSYKQLREERAVSSTELLEALHHREHLAREVASDKAEAIMSIREMREKLAEGLKNASTKEQLWSINKDFQATLDKLHVLTEYLDQVTYQTQGYMRLEVNTVSLSEFLYDTFEMLNKQDPMLAKQVLTQQHTTHQTLQADTGKLKQLLVDGLYYAQQQKQEGRPILFRIQEASLGYPITAIQDHIKEVDALCFIITTANTLPTPSTVYMVSVDRATIHLPKNAQELPITRNQQIVEAHYGTSEFIESTQGITQIYVVPVHVREVRPQTMDLLSTAEAMPDTISYPEEKVFIKEAENKTKIDRALLQKALQLIRQYHAGVKRKSGEPFYLHPIAVAHILLDYTKDPDTILAALLHDTVEDTRLSLTQISLNFNEAVKNIVDGVTHLDSNLKKIQLSTHENIQQLLEARDKRVLYVKLADRLHNMRTIEGHSALGKQKKIAEETLQFFVPMAKRLGIKPIAEELQKLSLAVLNRKQEMATQKLMST